MVAAMRHLRPLFAVVTATLALSVPSGSLAGILPDPNQHDFLFGVQGGLRYAVDTVPYNSDISGFATSEAGCGDQNWHLIGGGAAAGGSAAHAWLSFDRPNDYTDADAKPDDGFIGSGFGPTGSSLSTYSICAQSIASSRTGSRSFTINRRAPGPAPPCARPGGTSPPEASRWARAARGQLRRSRSTEATPARSATTAGGAPLTTPERQRRLLRRSHLRARRQARVPEQQRPHRDSGPRPHDECRLLSERRARRRRRCIRERLGEPGEVGRIAAVRQQGP